MAESTVSKRSADESLKRAPAELLRGLRSADAGAAWVEFLDRYAGLIMSTASQFEYDQNRVNECFLFVCEKLNDDGFRRLLSFDVEGRARFRTWLGTVVFNLCVDWHRQQYGRARLLPAISALPAFDQSVYRLAIEKGMSREACYQTLMADFPDLTRDLVVKSLSRIHSMLTPQQRWQISVRNRSRKRFANETSQDRIDTLPALGSGPEAELEDRQQQAILRDALSQLPEQQRLLIKLRFQQGLSLERIAELQCLGDSNRAWRQIQAAKRALSKAVFRTTTKSGRKT